MKYINRILMLPFAIVLWVFSVSIKWIRYGGQLQINLGEPVIDPKELLSQIQELNKKLDFFINKSDNDIYLNNS